MITLREPTLLDVLGVCLALPEDERAAYKALTGQEYDPDAVAADLWAMPGLRWCMADECGLPVVVCGYARMHPGTFRSWYCATSEAWERHGAEVTSLTREIICGVLAEPGVNRLETIALASRSRARRWYDRIGLTFESTLQGFGAEGEAAVMYVATRNAGNADVP